MINYVVLKAQAMAGLVASLNVCGASARADMGQADREVRAGIVEPGPVCGGDGCSGLWNPWGGDGCGGLSSVSGGNGCGGFFVATERFLNPFDKGTSRLLGDSKGNGLWGGNGCGP